MKKIIALLLMFAPATSFACSVCFTGREDFLAAFYVTTSMLILLPPMVLGSIGYYFYKQIRERNRLEDEELAKFDH